MTRPVFTPTTYVWAGQRPTVHWFYDARVQAWSKTVFADRNYDPSTTTVFDGDDPADRAVLLGCPDGYIRKLSSGAGTDDGTPIVSYVILGPYSGDGVHAILAELQAEIDVGSAPIKYEVSAGNTPEEALAGFDQAFVGDGTLTPGRTVTHNPRVGGRWIYIKLGTTDAVAPWALERLRLKFSIPTSSKRRAKN